jgi:hypothetical protein
MSWFGLGNLMQVPDINFAALSCSRKGAPHALTELPTAP